MKRPKSGLDLADRQAGWRRVYEILKRRLPTDAIPVERAYCQGETDGHNRKVAPVSIQLTAATL
jgi:hypothetical protein